MKEIQIDTTNVGMAISAAEVAALQPEVATALSHLHNGTGAGNDFIGWVDLPTRTPEELIDDIMATAQDMRERCDTVVCIGIGGSYLGAKAVIHALSPAFPQPGEKSTEVVLPDTIYPRTICMNYSSICMTAVLVSLSYPRAVLPPSRP